MPEHLTLEVVDQDGAIREALDEVQSSSRMSFLKQAVVAGGTIAAGGVLLGGMPKLALSAPGPAQDAAILKFALTLEYLEAEFYTTGLAQAGLIPAADRPIFAQISKHETAHVAFLRATLGAAAVAKPTFDFTAGGTFADVLSNYETYKAVSQAFEDTGVRAYKGQAGNLMANDAILTAALQIHSVEARHASEVRRLRGRKGWITAEQTDITAAAAVYDGEDNTFQGAIRLSGSPAETEAFDEPLTKERVLAIVDPFIV